MSEFKAENLECTRQDKILFQKLDFQLSEGDLLQIDGVNGSGKSSLMQICAGLIQASEGQILWNGKNIKDCRYAYQSDICYFGHLNGVKSGLTAKENMRVMHTLSGTSKTIDYSSILKKIGLPYAENTLTSRMSAGQKRRLGLSRILMTDATLWLLDEPFNALDKDGKAVIEQLITEHCHAGGMVIFATHQAMEIDGCELKHIHLGQE